MEALGTKKKLRDAQVVCREPTSRSQLVHVNDSLALSLRPQRGGVDGGETLSAIIGGVTWLKKGARGTPKGCSRLECDSHNPSRKCGTWIAREAFES